MPLDISDGDRYFFGILAASDLFLEFCRNDSFGCFSTIGSLHRKSQDFFMEKIWDSIVMNINDFMKVIESFHPHINPTNLQLYMKKDAAPNIISFMHLIYQSLSYDYASLP